MRTKINIPETELYALITLCEAYSHARHPLGQNLAEAMQRLSWQASRLSSWKDHAAIQDNLTSEHCVRE